MTWLLRVLIMATTCGVLAPAVSGQAPGVLHVKVVLVDADRKPTPVPRHALLISDNPASAEPRRVLTSADGTVDIRLRPGSYTVESDRPVVFNGQAYQWTRMIDIAAGQDASLELTADNAEVEAVTTPATTTTSPAPPLEDDPSFLLPRWQDSVVTLWTATTRASGFVIDARGLVATSQRALGQAASVEVQLSPSVKVAARVLAAEPRGEVAVLWIDPAITKSLPPVPLPCGAAASMPPIEYEQELFTIAAPRPGQKRVTAADVSRVEPKAIWADFRLDAGSVGGPVFTAGGGVVGISSLVGEAGREESWVIPARDVCDAVSAAEKKMRDAAPPSGTHLPVESQQPFPAAALEEAARRAPAAVTAYQMSSSDFDITFITPVLAYAARQRAEQFGDGQRSGGGAPDTAQDRARLLTDFGQWSDYAADFPPVLLVRVTPRLVEGFWKMLARGAAQTQGMSLPPMKSFKPGFARLRALCGTTEVTPIHPFTIEQRISAKEAIHEGLYAFDPGALTPECGTVKLVLFSEKAPEKGDTRLVDSKVVQQVWQDFAPLRARPRG